MNTPNFCSDLSLVSSIGTFQDASFVPGCLSFQMENSGVITGFGSSDFLSERRVSSPKASLTQNGNLRASMGTLMLINGVCVDNNLSREAWIIHKLIVGTYIPLFFKGELDKEFFKDYAAYCFFCFKDSGGDECYEIYSYPFLLGEALIQPVSLVPAELIKALYTIQGYQQCYLIDFLYQFDQLDDLYFNDTFLCSLGKIKQLVLKIYDLFSEYINKKYVFDFFRFLQCQGFYVSQEELEKFNIS